MKNILIVDDDEQMRRALRLMLEKNGFNVLEACSGEEAEELCKKEQPALVLMDIILPREHGLEAIHEILAFDPAAKIIAFSGIHQESIIRAALEAGAKDFLAKPFGHEEIIAAIRRYVD